MHRQEERVEARTAKAARTELARRAAQAQRDLESTLQQLTEDTLPDPADSVAVDEAPRERVLKRRAAAAQRDLDLTVAEMVRRIDRVQAPIELVRTNARRVGAIAGGGLVLLVALKAYRVLRRRRRVIHPRGARITKLLLILRAVEAFVVLGAAAYAVSPRTRATVEPWQRQARLAYRRLAVLLSRLFVRTLRALDGSTPRRSLLQAPLRPPRPRQPPRSAMGGSPGARLARSAGHGRAPLGSRSE